MKTKLTQLNANYSNTVCHTMLNIFIDKFDIILVMKPYLRDIGNNQKDPVALGA